MGRSSRGCLEAIRRARSPTRRTSCCKLAGPAWSEGWHESGPLDCVTTLGAKSASFAPHPKDELVATVTNELELGAHGSVFATSSGGTKADSAHLIRRDLTNADGAIVIRPDSASAHYLLFKFSDQAF